MNAFLVVSSVTALVLLCLSVLAGKRVPVSLSESYYALGRYGWVFQLLLAGASFTLLPVWISVTDNGHEWMAFLSCAALLFVAAAPCFRMEMEGKVHYTAAAVCCVCAVLWQISEEMWDVTLWLSFLGGMLSLQWRDKWCWWLECSVILSVYLNMFRLMF